MLYRILYGYDHYGIRSLFYIDTFQIKINYCLVAILYTFGGSSFFLLSFLPIFY